jgi:hypothetical protein
LSFVCVDVTVMSTTPGDASLYSWVRESGDDVVLAVDCAGTEATTVDVLVPDEPLLTPA